MFLNWNVGLKRTDSCEELDDGYMGVYYIITFLNVYVLEFIILNKMLKRLD